MKPKYNREEVIRRFELALFRYRESRNGDSEELMQNLLDIHNSPEKGGFFKTTLPDTVYHRILAYSEKRKLHPYQSISQLFSPRHSPRAIMEKL